MAAPSSSSAFVGQREKTHREDPYFIPKIDDLFRLDEKENGR